MQGMIAFMRDEIEDIKSNTGKAIDNIEETKHEIQEVKSELKMEKAIKEQMEREY